jgi:hypothetical protein
MMIRCGFNDNQSRLMVEDTQATNVAGARTGAVNLWARPAGERFQPWEEAVGGFSSGERSFIDARGDETGLRDDLEKFWECGGQLDVNAARKLREEVFLWHKWKKRVSDLPQVSLPMPRAISVDSVHAKDLIVRCGVVEMRVLESWMADPEELNARLIEVVEHRDSEDHMYAPPNRRHYLDDGDTAWSIRRLMTNAGMYVDRDPELAWSVLNEWCMRYMQAISHATAEFRVPGLFLHGFLTYQRRTELAGRLRPAQQGVRAWFSMLAGQVVLLATPFAKQIQEIFAGPEMPRLFSDYQLPSFKLITVPVPISTFPNRPHADWRQSFHETFLKCAEGIREHGATVFIASAGCYGLPLVDAIHSELQVMSLYRGHVVNGLLGVLSGAPSGNQLGPFTRNQDAWKSSDLSSWTNFGRIDGGRYV